MCGISGCYQQVDGDDLVRIMNQRMAHRGPDDEGIFSAQHGEVSVQLAHRRLSVIDLSDGGHQPFTRHGLTLVYNGELYNFRELRHELATGGTTFSTSSDTEVVLEAWRRWGPDALTRFRGMFALALFDERSGRLVLARDPLGIKPLHYLPRKDGVVFSSELKGIVERAREHPAGRPGGPAGVDPLLLGAAGPLCRRRGREARPGLVGRVPARRDPRRDAVLEGRGSRGGGGGRTGSSRWLR